MRHSFIHREPLTGPVAAFLLLVAALTPIWVSVLIAVAVSPWMVAKRSWDHWKL